MKKYELSIDEVALAVHRALCDIYPDRGINGKRVRELIFRSDDGSGNLVFKAHELAVDYRLETAELTDRLMLELNIEYEKNWHDRAFFHIIQDEKTICFRAVNDK
jgi:hypothetical protein